MAKGRKRKDSAVEDVEAYKHETETCKNAVPVEISFFTWHFQLATHCVVN